MPRPGYDCTDIPPGAPGGDVSVRAKHRRADGETPPATTARDQKMTSPGIESGNGDRKPQASRRSVGQPRLPDQNRIPPTNNENSRNTRSSKPGSIQGHQGPPSFGNVGAMAPNQLLPPHQSVEQTASNQPPTTHSNNNPAAQNAMGAAPGISMGQNPHTNSTTAKFDKELNVCQGMPAALRDNRRPRNSGVRHGVSDA